MDPYRVLITGEHSGLPSVSGSRKLDWIPVSVLEHRKLSVSSENRKALQEKTFDWVIFTSARTVRFFGELLLEESCELPAETRVACIGQATAETATHDGFTPDFVPSLPGSESFLEEFLPIVNSMGRPLSILIPSALQNRTTIQEALSGLGHTVLHLALYETVTRDDLKISPEILDGLSAIVFTSPSSVKAFQSATSIPPGVPLVAMGQFTQEHLRLQGHDSSLLPGGDFSRIVEVLS